MTSNTECQAIPFAVVKQGALTHCYVFESSSSLRPDAER